MIDPAASDDPRDDFADSFTEIDPSAPALSVGEFSTQRGDGIFESIVVIDGHGPDRDSELLAKSEPDRFGADEVIDLPVSRKSCGAGGDKGVR